jgi:hypothetical protein
MQYHYTNPLFHATHIRWPRDICAVAQVEAIKLFLSGVPGFYEHSSLIQVLLSMHEMTIRY